MRRLFLATSATLLVSSVFAQDVSLEYQVKAAYLFNFTKFVQWPQGAMRAGVPFTICVARRNPFGKALSTTIDGETVGGIGLEWRLVRNGLNACRILFVPRGVRAESYLRRLGDAPVLTVGESPDFLERGGIINFVLESGRVRFEISQSAAARVQLGISSRLLQLARNEGRSGASE